MKGKRHKKVEKHMDFYERVFGFHKPYQILIDGTFCQASLQNKVNIREQLPSFFGCETKLLTTQCVILETERFGKHTFGAMIIAKTFGIHKCGHEGSPVSATNCLVSMLEKENPNRYVIASQDPDLRKAARAVKGTPILFLNRSAPTLERPSGSTQMAASGIDQSKYKLSIYERERLNDLSKAILGQVPQKPSEKRRKVKRGKNPLSCKKKKTELKGVSKKKKKKKTKGVKLVQNDVGNHSGS